MPNVAMALRLSELFSLLDHHKMSITCEKKVLKIYYHEINNETPLVKEKDLHCVSYRRLSLARLFTLAGSEWTGGVSGMAAPRTWN